jgi:hypothetical protein
MKQVRIPDTGVVAVPCACCGEFKFTMNAADYKAARDSELIFICRGCHSRYAREKLDARMYERFGKVHGIRKAIKAEYSRTHPAPDPKPVKKPKRKRAAAPTLPLQQVIQMARVVADMAQMVDGEIAGRASDLSDQIIRTNSFAPGDLADLLHYERILTAKLLMAGIQEKAR